MVEQGDPDLDALIREARVEFARRLPAKATELGEMIARGDWTEARRAAHKLCGSAGVYGFEAVGIVAGAIEDVLIVSEGHPGPEARATIREKLDSIRVEAERACLEMR